MAQPHFAGEYTMSRTAASLAVAKSTQEPMIEMNMTPLIDVMLVLIIMLIITIPRQNHAINIGLGGEVRERAEPVVVTIDVDFDGTVLWDGALVPNRAALLSKLSAVANARVQPEVHLRANKLAPYKFVANVMATAQRAGVTGIGITGHEQFM